MSDNFENIVAEKRLKWQSFYDPNLPLKVPPYTKSPAQWFSHWVATNKEKPYIITNTQTFSYTLANEYACKIAGAFFSLGIRKGDHVAVLSSSSPVYIFIIQALFKLGAIEVPLGCRLTSREIQQEVARFICKTIVADQTLEKTILELEKHSLDFVENVVFFSNFDVNISTNNKHHSLAELIKEQPPTFENQAVSANDLARIQPTGGTTGLPKGAEITNNMLYSQGFLTAQTYTAGYRSVPQQDIRVLCTLSISHIYGYNANLNLCLHTGGTIILVENSKAEHIQAAIRQFSPNLYATVPSTIIKLIALGRETSGLDFSSLVGIFCGSSPLPVEVIRNFEELSGVVISEGYGMSEATGPITITPTTTVRKLGSSGVPRPETDVLIVDLEKGTNIVNEGELIVRGPTIISRYWNHPDETKLAIREGWFYTGDIARMDEDGYVFIVDRKKDLIITNGENVFPREIEKVVYELKEVREVACVGFPHERKGEVVKIFVKLHAGENLTETEIIEHCKKNLARFKTPSIVVFTSEMMYTSAGKIDKRALAGKKEAEMDKEVYQINRRKCSLCGLCADICPVEAISPFGLRKIDTEKCTACGLCAESCPSGAISKTTF